MNRQESNGDIHVICIRALLKEHGIANRKCECPRCKGKTIHKSQSQKFRHYTNLGDVFKKTLGKEE